MTLSDVASVGGLNLTGTFEVASVTDDAYVITVGSQAIAGQTGGGSSATYGHTWDQIHFQQQVAVRWCP